MRAFNKAVALVGMAAFLATMPAVWAATTSIKGSSSSVSVEVPDGFTASSSKHGIEIKTPDEEVMVWFETYRPDQQAALLKEHDAYWADQEVKLGAPSQSTESGDGHEVIATNFKAATWKGKPTVVRYLFIDGGFSSGEKILMSLWASPEGFQEHNADLSKMVNSIDLKD